MSNVQSCIVDVTWNLLQIAKFCFIISFYFSFSSFLTCMKPMYRIRLVMSSKLLPNELFLRGCGTIIWTPWLDILNKQFRNNSRKVLHHAIKLTFFPQFSACPQNYYFYCTNGVCTHATYVCDKFNDCGDNSDERSCSGEYLNVSYINNLDFVHIPVVHVLAASGLILRHENPWILYNSTILSHRLRKWNFFLWRWHLHRTSHGL